MIKPPHICSLAVLLLAGVHTVAAQTGSPADDEAPVAANIKLLYSDQNETREAAARELRRIVAKYPSRTTDLRRKDGGRSYWMEKVSQVVSGMNKEQVSKLLPVFKEIPETSIFGSGASHTSTHRLDLTWVVKISYGNPDKVINTPELVKRSAAVWIDRPKDYNGDWTCFYVNGEKAVEVQYRSGKNDGTFTRFYDNGKITFQQHYTSGVIEGTDTGWYEDGKLMYTAQYKNGKQDGRWVHYFRDGTIFSEHNYKNGVQNGMFAQWHPNGRKRLEINYLNGARHGIEAAWNENGVLQYKREYRNGTVLE